MQAAPNLSRPVPDGPPGYRSPNELNESWDPSDDEKGTEQPREVNWTWHGRQSWGRRAVAAFPIVGILLAVALFVHTTTSAQGAIDQVQSVVGTGGATLLSSAPPTAAVDTAGSSQLSDYQNVTFSQPSGPSGPIQGSTSLALPPYVGWEANGSAGPGNGLTTVSGGLLHVAVRRASTGLPGLVPHHYGHDALLLCPPVLGGIAPARHRRLPERHRRAGDGRADQRHGHHR